MATVKFNLHRAYKADKAPKVSNGNDQQEKINKPINRNKKTKRTLVDKDVRLYANLIIRMGEVIKIKTRHKVLPSEWDFKKQAKKDTVPGHIEFNQGLLQLKKDILEKYDQTIIDHPDMTFNGIHQILKNYGREKEIPFLVQKKDFFEYLDEYIEFLKGEVTYRTAQKYTTLKNSLKDFGLLDKNKTYQSLSFSQIDFKFLDAYRKYLRSQKPRGRQKSRPEDDQKGILIDTEGKYIETLKTFCRWSEERGYNKYSVYKRFKNFSDAHKKLRKPKNEIISLTLHELKQFYGFDFSSQPHLERVRDLFCFAAYTGQRWSDIERFDKNDLSEDIWTFEAYKTKKRTSIDLIGYASPALDVLRKYDYQLPSISLVKFNKNIKIAAGIAGIDSETTIKRYRGSEEISVTKPKFKFITSHSARRTCISLLLNEFNIPITHVLQITGHSDLKTLQVYIDKNDRSRREFMSRTVPVTEIKLKIAQ